jgi:ribonuclease HI
MELSPRVMVQEVGEWSCVITTERSARERAVFFPSASDPEGAELLACRMALEMAREAGVPRIMVETDCKGMVTKLNSDGTDRSIHGPMVEDIKFWLRDFDDYKVQFVRHSANEDANRLAKEGCKNKLCAS